MAQPTPPEGEHPTESGSAGSGLPSGQPALRAGTARALRDLLSRRCAAGPSPTAAPGAGVPAGAPRSSEDTGTIGHLALSHPPKALRDGVPLSAVGISASLTAFVNYAPKRREIAKDGSPGAM